MTKLHGWILAVLLILAWTAIPESHEDETRLTNLREDTTSIEPVPNLPRCTEDAVLVGIGDFEDGRWTAYACGPAVDDYEGKD